MKLGFIYLVGLIASVIQLTAVSGINCYDCTDIAELIAEEKNNIIEEKNDAPKGYNYEREHEFMSINAVVESYGDIQRIFENIAEKLNITQLSDAERDAVQQQLSSCTSFQDLVSECKSLTTVPNCDSSSPYRTYDGTCNNLRHSRWGSMFSEFRRILPPNYQGLKNYRESVLGGQLPNPRVLSLNLNQGELVLSHNFSHMFMYFSQLISHDSLDTAAPRVNGDTVKCCGGAPLHPYCDPIQMSESDPFFSRYNITCGRFLRTPTYPTCAFTKREHFNSVPTFLDVHFTYGRTEVEANGLRTNDGTGKLLVQQTNFGPLLVGNKSEDDAFCILPTDQCFLGGDARINQHTTLTTLHVLFMREHNRMAAEFKTLNPHWDGNRIYQETRKILGAKMQSIVYKHYLPLFLGEDIAGGYGLLVGGGKKNHYDPDVDPSLSSEFTAFSFRLHNLVGLWVAQVGCARTSVKDSLNNDQPIHEGCVGDYLSGIALTPQKQFDRFLSSDITHLARPASGGKGYGADFAAIDINRGRDRGMASYVDYLNLWSEGAIVISSFEDFAQVMSAENAQLLKENYRDVRDVDAWVGMVMEDRLPGAVGGPTTISLLAEHFLRQKKGDRFYFENQGSSNSFTSGQIKAVKRTSLSQMICDNMNVTSMPQNAFLLPGDKNPIVNCEDFKPFNLNPWKEKKSENNQ